MSARFLVTVGGWVRRPDNVRLLGLSVRRQEHVGAVQPVPREADEYAPKLRVKWPESLCPILGSFCCEQHACQLFFVSMLILLDSPFLDVSYAVP